MKNFLALLAGGATAGALFVLLPKLRFGPTESKVLSVVIGVIVWFSISQAGKKKDNTDNETT